MVACSVCGVRIASAFENFGSFPTARGEPHVSDTCDRCAGKLAAAVSAEVKRILTALGPKESGGKDDPMKKPSTPPPFNAGDYITCVYEDSWIFAPAGVRVWVATSTPVKAVADGGFTYPDRRGSPVSVAHFRRATTDEIREESRRLRKKADRISRKASELRDVYRTRKERGER